MIIAADLPSVKPTDADAPAALDAPVRPYDDSDESCYLGWLADDEAIRETSEQYDDLRISGEWGRMLDDAAELADLDARAEMYAAC